MAGSTQVRFKLLYQPCQWTRRHILYKWAQQVERLVEAYNCLTVSTNISQYNATRAQRARQVWLEALSVGLSKPSRDLYGLID